MEPLLSVRDLWVHYSSNPALRGVDIEVPEGGVVAIIGPNGSGKSTLLKSIIGYVKPSRGRVVFRGEDITGLDPSKALRMGIVYVPERRRVFPELSVEKNLLIGSYIRGVDKRRSRELLDLVYSLFPNLRVKRSKPAAVLSGGEAQMVAVGRGIMSDPEVLLLDEPSLGLAPRVVASIYDAVSRLNRSRGVTVVVADQMLRALEISSHGYVISNGVVIEHGDREYLMRHKTIVDVYFKYS